MVHETEEETRLLEESIEPPSATIPDTGVASSWNSKHHNALRIVLSIAFIALILDAGNYIADAPTTAVLERTICSRYHSVLGGGAVLGLRDDEHCKSEPIQSELAVIVGWKDTFECLPGVLLAVPYGIVADRIGRKRVLLLCFTGLLLSDGWTRVVLWYSDVFPVRMVWLSGLWQIIGGGPTTADALSTVIIAEVCPAEKRTVAFSVMQVARLLSEFLIIPVGAALMTIDPWIPLLLSTIIAAISIVLTALLVPETLTVKEKAGMFPDEADETSSLLSRTCLNETPAHNSGGRNIATRKLREASRWVSRNLGVVLIILACFFTILGRQSSAFLLQYTTKKFHWSYAKASYLISLRSLVNLLVVLFLTSPMPEAIRIRLGAGTLTTDKRLTQLSASFLVSGYFMIFIAGTPVLLALGQAVSALGLAFTVTARSLVGGLVDQRHLGAVYTAVSVMIYCGGLVGGPLLAACYHWGLLLAQFWMGLPFLVSTGTFVMALLAVSLVRTGGGHIGRDDVGDDI